MLTCWISWNSKRTPFRSWTGPTWIGSVCTVSANPRRISCAGQRTTWHLSGYTPIRWTEQQVCRTTGLVCDQTIRLKNHYAAKHYAQHLCRIKYDDKELNKTFVFLTNHFEAKALEVALLYKYRWQIELFFKWIKQHLRIKVFWGRERKCSQNPGLGSSLHLCAGCNLEGKTQPCPNYERNITNPKRLPI